MLFIYIWNNMRVGKWQQMLIFGWSIALIYLEMMAKMLNTCISPEWLQGLLKVTEAYEMET